jgi:hypothetical protein
MRSLTRRAFLAAALTVAAAACASNKSRPLNQQEQTTLLVRNDNFLEHNIYLVYGGQRIRLGTARSNATTKFVIPSQYVFGVTALQFLADPIGGTRTPVSDQISVSPGDEIQLIIPPTSSPLGWSALRRKP